MSTTDADLVVLGAGPAGLGAALRAARAGHRVVVLEREQHVGGLAASFEVDGIRVDHGSHRLHRTVDPRILADLRDLLGDDLQRRRRNGRVRLAGRWIAFPLKAGDLLRNLPPDMLASAAFDTITAWARRPRADTFTEVVRAGLGPTLATRFYLPYARKLWGVDPDRISGEQARRRVGVRTPGRLLARLVRGRDPEANTFHYPRRGYGQIAEALARAAVAAGAELRLGAEVTRVAPGPDAVVVSTADGAGGRVGSRVWSTIPLPALARLCDPGPPAGMLDAASSLRFRAMVLVYLVLDTPRFTPYDAHYLPELSTPVSRISEPTNYRDDPGDPDDRTVLCAEIPCDAGDELWRSDDADLADRVMGTLLALGLPGARLLSADVRRLGAVYPIYHAGYADAFEALDRWVGSHPRLLTFGRLGLFAHDNAHHALAMAWAAGDALGPSGGFDEAAWAAARRRFEAHVVED